MGVGPVVRLNGLGVAECEIIDAKTASGRLRRPKQILSSAVCVQVSMGRSIENNRLWRLHSPSTPPPTKCRTDRRAEAARTVNRVPRKSKILNPRLITNSCRLRGFSPKTTQCNPSTSRLFLNPGKGQPAVIFTVVRRTGTMQLFPEQEGQLIKSISSWEFCAPSLDR